MADLRLSFACTPYDRIQPLITGEVKPDGITLEYEGAPGGVPRIFYEQIKFQRYDVSEMSMSSYLRMRPVGLPFRLLPVFHNRNFSHTYIQVRRESGIRQGHPEDLKGKRIGIGDYQQSLGLWTRGILQMEFGVKPEDMVWYQERGEHFSHTGASAAAGLKLPANLKLNYAKADFNTMFAKGDLDATTGLGFRSGRAEASGLSRIPASGIDRARTAAGGAPDLVTLFADPKAEAIRFFKKTGVYPPNHTTVVRESILDAHPWVALSLMEAFEESKRVAGERFRRNVPSLIVFGPNYIREIDEVFGPDPFPYGIKANAKAFDMAQTFSVEQGLSGRKQPFEDIFPQEVIYSEERLT
jgi:4,5-dihydroxyphthalate decarboxylase